MFRLPLTVCKLSTGGKQLRRQHPRIQNLPRRQTSPALRYPSARVLRTILKSHALSYIPPSYSVEFVLSGVANTQLGARQVEGLKPRSHRAPFDSCSAKPRSRRALNVGSPLHLPRANHFGPTRLKLKMELSQSSEHRPTRISVE